jgi:hypothetical protein
MEEFNFGEDDLESYFVEKSIKCNEELDDISIYFEDTNSNPSENFIQIPDDLFESSFTSELELNLVIDSEIQSILEKDYQVNPQYTTVEIDVNTILKSDDATELSNNHFKWDATYIRTPEKYCTLIFNALALGCDIDTLNTFEYLLRSRFTHLKLIPENDPYKGVILCQQLHCIINNGAHNDLLSEIYEVIFASYVKLCLSSKIISDGRKINEKGDFQIEMLEQIIITEQLYSYFQIRRNFNVSNWASFSIDFKKRGMLEYMKTYSKTKSELIAIDFLSSLSDKYIIKIIKHLSVYKSEIPNENIHKKLYIPFKQKYSNDPLLFLNRDYGNMTLVSKTKEEIQIELENIGYDCLLHKVSLYVRFIQYTLSIFIHNFRKIRFCLFTIIIFFFGFFVIHNPVFLIHYVLIVILTSLQVESNEPLISKVIKVHRMSNLPFIHRST